MARLLLLFAVMKPRMTLHGRIVILASCVVLGSAGCANVPRAHAPAIDRAELVKSAMFDHDCPAESIHVIRSEDDPSGTSRFVVDVCGKRRTYKRIGTMYYDADRSDPLS